MSNQEAKIEAIRLLASGVKAHEVSAKLDIPESLLNAWDDEVAVERALDDALVSPLGSRRVETREPGQSKTLELLHIGIRQTEREAARSALAAALPPEVEVRIIDHPGAYV